MTSIMFILQFHFCGVRILFASLDLLTYKLLTQIVKSVLEYATVSTLKPIVGIVVTD